MGCGEKHWGFKSLCSPAPLLKWNNEIIIRAGKSIVPTKARGAPVSYETTINLTLEWLYHSFLSQMFLSCIHSDLYVSWVLRHKMIKFWAMKWVTWVSEGGSTFCTGTVWYHMEYAINLSVEQLELPEHSPSIWPLSTGLSRASTRFYQVATAVHFSHLMSWGGGWGGGYC